MSDILFQIIHLGNPYDFVVKNHATNRTYGTFQGDKNSMEEMLNDITDEINQLKQEIAYFKTTYAIQEQGLDIEPAMCSISSPTKSRYELHEENLHLNYDNKRMVDFIMSKGYGLKDYLDFCKEYKE